MKKLKIYFYLIKQSVVFPWCSNSDKNKHRLNKKNQFQTAARQRHVSHHLQNITRITGYCANSFQKLQKKAYFFLNWCHFFLRVVIKRLLHFVIKRKKRMLAYLRVIVKEGNWKRVFEEKETKKKFLHIEKIRNNFSKSFADIFLNFQLLILKNAPEKYKKIP